MYTVYGVELQPVIKTIILFEKHNTFIALKATAMTSPISTLRITAISMVFSTSGLMLAMRFMR